MTKNQDSIVHPDHVEVVEYFEDSVKLNWYMNDSWIHIDKITNTHDLNHHQASN